MIGKTISHYEILAKLGAGGMGEVYKTRDVSLDRLVALKFLKPHIDDDPHARQRFVVEAKAASALDHRNVGTIYEIGEVDGRTFIAMAYYGGESLADEIRRGPLELTRALDVTIQVGEGLAEAHRHDIIHRDIKPGNVIVTERGEAKILDFGLAKLLGSTRLTQSGATVGTIAYMSPEQAQGRDVDRRADVWALGALLYELLVCRPPFRGTHEQAIVYSIMNEDPVPLTAQRAGLPLEIDRFISKALAKDPSERFQSMDDMLVDLRALRAGAKTSKLAVRAYGRPSRVKFALALGGVFLVGIAAGFGLSKWMGGEAPATAPHVGVLISSGTDHHPAASPDGKSIAFASARTGVSRIWIKQLASGDEVALTDGNDDTPRYSPDGAQILFVRRIEERTSLWRVSSAGGPARRIVDDATEGAWSPDGQELAFVRASRDTSEIWVAQGDGSNPRRIYSQADFRIWGMGWSPDGRHLLACLDVPFVPTPLRFLIISPRDGAAHTVDPDLGLKLASNAVWLDNERIAYSIMEALYTSLNGQASRVVERSLRSGKVNELVSVPVACTDLAVLGPGRLLLGLEQVSQNLLLINEPGRAHERVRNLTRGASSDRQPVLSPDGRRLIFSSNRSGNLDLWEMDLESGALSRMTDDSGDDWDPSFRSDGRGILWSSNRTGNFEIWTASEDGSDATQLSHTGVDAQNPELTADGKWILFVNNRPPDHGVWKMRTDGSEPRLLARNVTMPMPARDADLFSAATEGYMADRVLRVFRVGDGSPLPWNIVLSQRFDLLPGRSQWIASGQLAYVDSDASSHSGITVRNVSEATAGSPRVLAGFDPLQPTESFDITADGARAVTSVRNTLRTIAIVDNVPGITGPARTASH